MKVKKSFIFYALIWLVAFLMFVSIAFIIPKNFLAKKVVEENAQPIIVEGQVVGYEDKVTVITKYQSPVFWVAFAAIVISFFGQLACAFVANMGEENKSFLGMPLLFTSGGSLIIMLLIGSFCMLFYRFLGWFGIIVCILALGFNAISVFASKLAGDKVGEIDKKIKVQTMYIKMLTADAQTTMAKAEGDEMKELTRKVYEAIRYSDPMSDDLLASVEEKISAKFAEFDEAVEQKNFEGAEEASKSLMILITERNAKCKVLK